MMQNPAFVPTRAAPASATAAWQRWENVETTPTPKQAGTAWTRPWWLRRLSLRASRSDEAVAGL